MAKPEMEFTDTLPLGQWRQVEGAEGVFEKILSWDPDTGNLTRLVKFGSGVRIPKTQVHDFCEEVFILGGYMVDTAKNLTAAERTAKYPVFISENPVDVNLIYEQLKKQAQSKDKDIT